MSEEGASLEGVWSKGQTVAFRARGLVKTYGHGESLVTALRGVDLDIPEGKIIVLLGPSGSGKSTLLNILGGLDHPSGGSLMFRDRPLSEFDDDGLTAYRRRHVGFIFQMYNLMPGLTARENVSLVTEISTNPMEPDEALELVGLGHRLDHFPSQMSGGEQQRVAIARAIAKKPEVLFCDEPTGALDSNTSRKVLRALLDVNQTLGTTQVIVTHHEAIADMADRVIHFKDGHVSSIHKNVYRVEPEDLKL